MNRYKLRKSLSLCLKNISRERMVIVQNVVMRLDLVFICMLEWCDFCDKKKQSL